MRVAEDNGLRHRGEPFESRLASREIVRVSLRSRLLRPPHPLARYTRSLVLAQEFKSPARGGLHIKSKPFKISPWRSGTKKNVHR
jgi:hypothetical protein